MGNRNLYIFELLIRKTGILKKFIDKDFLEEYTLFVHMHTMLKSN